MRLRQVAKSGLCFTLCAGLLVGCDSYPFRSKNGTLSDMQDRQQELTRQDFRDMNKASKLLPDDATVDADLGAPPIPELAQVLAAPRPPKVANTKLVTLSVTDDVPLRDVLFELGRLANVDIEVGSGLDTQGINLRATDRPFNEVIQRIAELGNLRYSVDGKSIRVERDLAYMKNYPLDFVNIVRSSQSSYTLSTSILASGGGSGGGGGGGSSGGGSSGGGGSGDSVGSVGTSGSSSSISGSSEGDLWTSLEASITEILNYNPGGVASVAAGAAGDPAAAAGAAATAATGAAGATGASAGFVINRQAGVLTVNATERQHEMVQRFLTLMARNASAQVLIEAKIVEVSLDEQFLSGVDWNGLLGSAGGVYGRFGSYPISAGTNFPEGLETAVIGINKGDLDGLVSLTERFGTTRTLSSPRLSAINNQQAVLTFARNEVFFDCTVTPGTVTPSGDGSAPTITPSVRTCEPQSVPIGIVLNILPSINMDTQEVTLSVRPTLTRQVGQAVDPSTDPTREQLLLNGIDPDALGIETVTNVVPVIEVREIDSLMKVKSGGVMIIGGLMEDNSTTQNVGVPGVSEIPFIGSAFKNRNETYGKRELIIFIKATIVHSDGSTGRVDRSVLDRFTTDPRPLFRPKLHDAK